MESKKSRLLNLNITSLIFFVIVAAVLIWANCHLRSAHLEQGYGWPNLFLLRGWEIRVGEAVITPRWEFHYFDLIIDVIVGFSILVGSTMTIELAMKS